MNQLATVGDDRPSLFETEIILKFIEYKEQSLIAWSIANSAWHLIYLAVITVPKYHTYKLPVLVLHIAKEIN
jgi:hypothetical protein